MKKRVFDIKRGHYVFINEADESSDTQQSQSSSSTQQKPQTDTQQQSKQVNVSVESDERIKKLNAELTAADTRYSNQKASIETAYSNNKATQQKMLDAALAAASEGVDGTFDKVQTNKDVLSIRQAIADLDLKHTQDICRLEISHAEEVHKIESNKYQILTTLTNEGYMRMPKKYRSVLNESNIQQAKVYMGDLVVNDDDHIIKDMRDFKRVMSEHPEVVYGKDKNGYFVICIDQDDFNNLYSIMTEVGYSKDDVFANIMPQILDRSGMISTAN